jgi:serine/threonine protein kinase/Tfp pilus assembly protein PilF
MHNENPVTDEEKNAAADEGTNAAADEEKNAAADDKALGPLSVGDLVADRYEVLAHIGSGGMGEVYKVLDRQTQIIYALKMISPLLADQRTLAKRLEHEARAARTLIHGNIVTVYDVGKSTDGAPYLLMDYVEGDSLETLLKTDVLLTQERALSIFLQIAEALVHAHQKGVVHRDLKPSNILMTKTDGGAEMVKIVDFGIAKVSNQEKEDKAKLTQTGELVGTPLYMSPEQCTGEEIDARSDIYSFGCIMYETLTGKTPFAAENPVKVILKHLSEAPPPLPNGAGISNDLKLVVMRCLEKHRSDRYATPVDLHIDLERIQNNTKIKPHRRKLRTSATQKMVAAAACAVVVMGAAGVAIIQQFTHSAVVPVARVQHRVEKWGGKTLAQWTSAIEKSPDDPELYFNRGQLHSQRDERTNAIDDFTQAISLKPSYIAAYESRAYTYGLNAQTDKAAQDANKVISMIPDSAEGYQTRAWVYSTREQYGEAIADYKRAAAMGESGYICWNMAKDEMKLGHYAEASSAARRGIELDDDFSKEALAGLIDTFQQKYDDAYTHLKKATDDPEARGIEWQVLAYYYTCVGKQADGQHAVDQAKILETFPARAFRLAGEYYRTAGEYEKAIQEFSASTSLEDYAPGYRERAISYMSVGQWRAAYGDMKKAFQINPFSTTTLSFLALTESQLGMKAEAQEHINKALQAKAIAPIILVNRAKIDFANGDNQKALEYADKAISRDPYLKEAYEARVEIRKKLGNAAGATDDANKAKNLFSHLDF